MMHEYKRVWLHIRWPLQTLTLTGLLFSSLIVKVPVNLILLKSLLSWMLLSIGLTLFNDYFDKDEEKVAGLAHPPPVSKSLFIVSIISQVSSLLIAVSINAIFGLSVLLGVVLSFLYSAVRLKKNNLLVM